MSTKQIIIDKHTGKHNNEDLKIDNEQIDNEEASVSPLTKTETSILFNQNEKLPYERKNKSIGESDDSFEIFVPLKVKTSNKGSNCAYPNKLKKKKTISSNRICPYFTTRKSPSSKEDKDLQIALARSLADVSHSNLSENVLKAVTNDIKTTQQHQNFLKSLTNKTKKPGTNTLLFRRTIEERQNILTKKVAIVLIGNENINCESIQKQDIELISSVLEGAWDKNSTLWERSKTEINNLADFYVTPLEKFIELPSASEAMSETSRFKGNDNANESSDDMDNIKDENENNQLEDSYEALSDEDKTDRDQEFNTYVPNDFSQYNIINKDKFITESLNLLSDEFFAIFGTNELSDVEVILKTSEILPCHRFLLHVRCPSLLKKSESSKVHHTLDFSQYSARATRAFFKYIYTGKIEFIYDLPSDDKSDLYVLAKKYNVEFLERFILSAFRSDSFHLYSQSTCSPPQSLPRSSPDSSQGPKEIIPNEFPQFEVVPINSPLINSFKLSDNKQGESLKISHAYYTESVNNQPSCSGLNSSINSTDYSFERPFTFLPDDNSVYDMFNDQLKSPCNSSFLLQNLSQTKRKLNYSNIINESKKLCSESISENINNSPEIVSLDSSSSDDDFPTTQKNNVPYSSNLLEVNSKPQSSTENSNNNFNFNVTGLFASEVELQASSTMIHPIIDSENIAPSTIVSSPSIRTSLVMKTPHNSERSIDRYFESSFPDLSENIDNIEEVSSQPNISKTPVQPMLNNLSRNALTPLQEIIIDDATPKPDYGAMISPELKVELRKYGIKPDLDNNKARALLRYIYAQIHPMKSELPRYQSPTPSTSKEMSPSPVIIIDDDSSQSDQANTRKNSENDFAYEEYLFNESKERNENSPKESGTGSLRRTVVRFIKSNNELFTNVVLFRPLLLKKFYKTFREHGVKCSLNELMDVLDDLCVNYHVEKSEASQKRRYKRKFKRKQQK